MRENPRAAIRAVVHREKAVEAEEALPTALKEALPFATEE
jgi:hypothetical protein